MQGDEKKKKQAKKQAKKQKKKQEKKKKKKKQKRKQEKKKKKKKQQKKKGECCWETSARRVMKTLQVVPTCESAENVSWGLASRHSSVSSLELSCCHSECLRFSCQPRHLVLRYNYVRILSSYIPPLNPYVTPSG